MAELEKGHRTLATLGCAFQDISTQIGQLSEVCGFSVWAQAAVHMCVCVCVL